MLPLRHIYNNPDLNRIALLSKLRRAAIKGIITSEEYQYLEHLIRKENENAQRANGCTY